MMDSPFAYSFDKLPDSEQWQKLKEGVPQDYCLLDSEMMAKLHRSQKSLPMIDVHEWFDYPDIIRNRDEDEVFTLIEEHLPEDYKIPDMMRFKNVFQK